MNREKYHYNEKNKLPKFGDKESPRECWKAILNYLWEYILSMVFILVMVLFICLGQNIP